MVSGIVPGFDIEKQRKHTIDIMKALPKDLVFDGKSNWFAFKHKFELFATKLGWTSDDCFNCLCWSLTGKAADFYAILLEQKHMLNYRQLLSKLRTDLGLRSSQPQLKGYLYSFVVYLYVNDIGSITSVGEERANLSAVVYL